MWQGPLGRLSDWGIDPRRSAGVRRGSPTAKEMLTVTPGSVAGELTKIRGNAHILRSGPAVTSLSEVLKMRQFRCLASAVGVRDVFEDDEI